MIATAMEMAVLEHQENKEPQTTSNYNGEEINYPYRKAEIHWILLLLWEERPYGVMY